MQYPNTVEQCPQSHGEETGISIFDTQSGQWRLPTEIFKFARTQRASTKFILKKLKEIQQAKNESEFLKINNSKKKPKTGIRTGGGQQIHLIIYVRLNYTSYGTIEL